MSAIVLILAVASGIAAGFGQIGLWWAFAIALASAVLGPVEDEGWRPLVARYWKNREFGNLARLCLAGFIPYAVGCGLAYLVARAISGS